MDAERRDMILVTGGTGTLGRPTVRQLRTTGHELSVLSRKPGAGRVVADLSTGEDLPAALDGVETVVHLATTRWRDVKQTRRLLDAARAAGVTHLLFISIVGVDRIPYGYYRDKVASEAMIEQSGIPFTILRATQFHEFPAGFFRAQRRLPFRMSLDMLDQPIDVDEVASRLVELVDAGPSGRVPDIGGPEQLTVNALLDIWQQTHGTHRKVWTLRIPGATMRAFGEGHHMTPLPGYGTRTFAEFAAADAALIGSSGANGPAA
jgi:uncharacterized protein YbjT (DUF2867 family)